MFSKFRFKPSEIGVFSDKNSDLCVDSLCKDCRIVGLTNGEFSLIDLIYSVLKKIGPSSVIVATWSAGIKDAHQVRWMMDSNLILGFKILTDHSYVTRQSKYAASLTDLFGKENIRTTEMHAKFVLITNDNYRIAITSSMNLNANKTCELFEIDEGSGVYDLLKSYVLHTFENMESGFVGDNNKVSQIVKQFFNRETKGVDLTAPWWRLKSE